MKFKLKIEGNLIRSIGLSYMMILLNVSSISAASEINSSALYFMIERSFFVHSSGFKPLDIISTGLTIKKSRLLSDFSIAVPQNRKGAGFNPCVDVNLGIEISNLTGYCGVFCDLKRYDDYKVLNPFYIGLKSIGRSKSRSSEIDFQLRMGKANEFSRDATYYEVAISTKVWLNLGKLNPFIYVSLESWGNICEESSFQAGAGITMGRPPFAGCENPKIIKIINRSYAVNGKIYRMK